LGEFIIACWREVSRAVCLKSHRRIKNIVLWKALIFVERFCFGSMVVMHKKTIREYAESNAQAANGLEEWYQIAKAAD